MSVLARAQAHFKGLKPVVVDVPEWSEDGASPFPVTVHPLTVDDRRAIFKEGKSSAEASVDIIIRKACGPDGQPLFDAMDKREIMTTIDAQIVGRIAGAAFPSTPSATDAEKN